MFVVVFSGHVTNRSLSHVRLAYNSVRLARVRASQRNVQMMKDNIISAFSVIEK